MTQLRVTRIEPTFGTLYWLSTEDSESLVGQQVFLSPGIVYGDPAPFGAELMVPLPAAALQSGAVYEIWLQTDAFETIRLRLRID